MVENTDISGIGRAIGKTPHARRALRILDEAGIEAWLVGGCVRDALMGHAPHDVDIAAGAPWRRSAQAFRAAGCPVHETGTAHGTITAVVEGEPVEVTAYRIDGAYSDSRRPDSVAPAPDIESDLARRDFTMNAMAYHPARGLRDPYGGAGDVRRGIVRAVGDADARFSEDALRIARAARFASQLGFSIEDATLRAMDEHAARLGAVARERVGAELERLLTGDFAYEALMQCAEAIEVAVPEVASLRIARDDAPGEREAAPATYERMARGVKESPSEAALRWAALLRFSDEARRDGKPETPVGEHAARLAGRAMRRLRVRKSVIARAMGAIASWNLPLDGSDEAALLLACAVGEQAARDALALRRADALACGGDGRVEDDMLAALDAARERNIPLDVRELAVSGAAVASLAGARGPLIGRTLDALLAAVVEGAVENDGRELSAYMPRAMAAADENLFRKRLEKHLT